MLEYVIGERTAGPIFLRRRYALGEPPPLVPVSTSTLRGELALRLDRPELSCEPSQRETVQRTARGVWREMGALKTDEIRTTFFRLTRRIGLPELTAPKVLRHMFATSLQDANVDPLIRNQLMGHAPAGAGTSGSGLAMFVAVVTRAPPKRGKPMRHIARNLPFLAAHQTAVQEPQQRHEAGFL